MHWGLSLHLHLFDRLSKRPYINASIRAFSKRFQISEKSAFQYLYRFQALQLLDEFYHVEHLQSIDISMN
ncbi:DUF3791 domain-containing protein [Parabacteroides sp.]